MEGTIKQDLIYKKRDCIGIDIGTNSVKVVQLKKKKKFVKLIGYVTKKLPSNLMIEGIISDPEELAKIIREMISQISKGGSKPEKVLASIPDSRIFTRVLELPPMEEKEMKEAILWEADQAVPMALTDLVVDWKVLGPSLAKDGSNDVLLMAAPLGIVNTYVQLFNILDLQPEAIESSLCSIVRSLVSNKEQDEVVIIADIGGTATNLGVYDTALRFSDTVDVGGQKITEAIAEDMKISEEKAEKLKVDEGLKNSNVKEILRPLLGNLQSGIKKVIKYYQEKSNGTRKVEKVILCGGSSNLSGLTEFLASELGIEVKVGNPWVNINTYPLKCVPRNEVPSFANAIGLSLRGIEEEKLA